MNINPMKSTKAKEIQTQTNMSKKSSQNFIFKTPAQEAMVNPKRNSTRKICERTMKDKTFWVPSSRHNANSSCEYDWTKQ